MYMLYLLLALFIPEPVAVVEESCLYAEINTCENDNRYLVQIIFWEKGKEKFKEKDGTTRYYTGRVVKGFKVVANKRGEHNKKFNICRTELVNTGTALGYKMRRCIE